MNRHMQQIDHQTGEVVEGFVAYVVPKRKTDFRKDGWQWLRSNDDACSKQFNRQRHEGYVTMLALTMKASSSKSGGGKYPNKSA